MEQLTDTRDLLLNQGMQHLAQALEADNPARAMERLQGARAVASNLGRTEGGEANRLLLVTHGIRVRNVISNRDMLANAPDADQLVQCDYCKALVYPIPEDEANQQRWDNRRCVDHQDQEKFPIPEGGPVL